MNFTEAWLCQWLGVWISQHLSARLGRLGRRLGLPSPSAIFLWGVADLRWPGTAARLSKVGNDRPQPHNQMRLMNRWIPVISCSLSDFLRCPKPTSFWFSLIFYTLSTCDPPPRLHPWPLPSKAIVGSVEPAKSVAPARCEAKALRYRNNRNMMNNIDVFLVSI